MNAQSSDLRRQAIYSIIRELSQDDMKDIKATLDRTSIALGKFEAVDALVKGGFLDKSKGLNGADMIMVAILEDIHQRAADLMDGVDSDLDTARVYASKGYGSVYEDMLKGKSPDLDAIRHQAREVISSGWSIEERAPAFGVNVFDLEESIPVDPFDGSDFDLDRSADDVMMPN